VCGRSDLAGLEQTRRAGDSDAHKTQWKRETCCLTLTGVTRRPASWKRPPKEVHLSRPAAAAVFRKSLVGYGGAREFDLISPGPRGFLFPAWEDLSINLNSPTGAIIFFIPRKRALRLTSARSSLSSPALHFARACGVVLGGGG
jgi:hypothetical protein